MESLADGILEDREPLAIPLRTRASRPKPIITSHSGAGVANNPHQPKDVCFPGSTPQEAWRFTVLVRILELIHEALVNNKITTKRDIYYKDPSLFCKQEVVDRYIDDLAYTFEVPRSALNVVAAAKGLVIGRFIISRSDGTAVNGHSEHEGMIVPNIQDIDNIDVSWISWILVVEKEATFRSLAAGRFYLNPRVGDGIIITAKGYPDISTREFLQCLSLSHEIGSQSPHVFALVDFDPDGVGILYNYKYGSFKLAHQDAELNVPATRWLGIQSRDLQAYARSDTCDGILRLTARDRRKATLMLDKKTFAEDGPEIDWRRELQAMLMLNVKAEIQLMSGRAGGLEGWLEERVGECLEAEKGE
ncbi:Winged helix-turn-helix DNA-binding domain [Lasallia pustulata]|uniref:DNA topoisomerase (ATP-hydrolyzing) n=1 Tax=Lasallia pustulata TaxID=136370 RepID=A0A1W5D4D1_9LECA|nr:Winged helix-turn-helix DNA-binding domain [Lasallia pustulata]